MKVVQPKKVKTAVYYEVFIRNTPSIMCLSLTTKTNNILRALKAKSTLKTASKLSNTKRVCQQRSRAIRGKAIRYRVANFKCSTYAYIRGLNFVARYARGVDSRMCAHCAASVACQAHPFSRMEYNAHCDKQAQMLGGEKYK